MTSNGKALLKITPTLEQVLTDVLDYCIQRVKRSEQHAPFEKEGVTVFNEHRNLVFRLDCQPGIIFKTRIWEEASALESDMDRRLANSRRGRAALSQLKLSRLYLPKAQLLHITLFDRPPAFIAEEELPIGHIESLLAEEFEQLCQMNDGAFLEAIEQLALFIAETGFSDLEHRNIPPLRREGAPFQLAIIDVEHMDSPAKGILGEAKGCRSLVHCLSPDLARKTVALLESRGIFLDPSEVTRVLAARDAEWDRLRRLQNFYKRRGITSNAPIELNSATLAIPEADREAAVFFVEILNAKLESADPKEALATQRQLYLSWYEIREHLPRLGGVDEARRRIPLFLRLLRQAGLIFDVEPLPRASFWIQA